MFPYPTPRLLKVLGRFIPMLIVIRELRGRMFLNCLKIRKILTDEPDPEVEHAIPWKFERLQGFNIFKILIGCYLKCFNGWDGIL